MIGETWFISDTHFGHKNILKFDPEQGARWKCIEERDEEMVELWNGVVAKGDEVFHLGDVAFMQKSRLVPLLRRLHGRKLLLMGNHDKLTSHFYAEFFKILRQPFPWRDHFVLTHAPVHPMCLMGRWKTNIHGHVHRNIVCHSSNRYLHIKDPRYANVSVERTGYKPVHADVVTKGRVK